MPYNESCSSARDLGTDVNQSDCSIVEYYVKWEEPCKPRNGTHASSSLLQRRYGSKAVDNVCLCCGKLLELYLLCCVRGFVTIVSFSM